MKLGFILFLLGAAVGPSPLPSRYPLPAEDRAKIRELQYQSQGLEIEKQHLLVRISEIERQQDQLTYQMQGVAFDFAMANHIDLRLYHLDGHDPAFVQNGSK